MQYSLNLTPQANSFELTIPECFDEKIALPDFNLLKQATDCKTHKEILSFLSNIPPECTEYENISFKKIRQISDPTNPELSGESLEKCSIQEMFSFVKKQIILRNTEKTNHIDDPLDEVKKTKTDWNVTYTSKATKQVAQLGKKILNETTSLMSEMTIDGPILPKRSHFDSLYPKKHKIPKDSFHCHINDGSPTYVACWNILDQNKKMAEIFYVGTHEQAPYKKK